MKEWKKNCNAINQNIFLPIFCSVDGFFFRLRLDSKKCSNTENWLLCEEMSSKSNKNQPVWIFFSFSFYYRTSVIITKSICSFIQQHVCLCENGVQTNVKNCFFFLSFIRWTEVCANISLNQEVITDTLLHMHTYRHKYS